MIAVRQGGARFSRSVWVEPENAGESRLSRKTDQEGTSQRKADRMPGLPGKLLDLRRFARQRGLA